MGIIFDLDQTLVDTSHLETLRKQRNWKKIYAQIPSLIPYEGINEIIQSFNSREIPIGIVTTSPESYCSRIIRHCGWEIAATVCYHDVKRRKPHPESMHLILQKLGLGNQNVISIGDRAMDIVASKQAGIVSVAATWGSKEVDDLLATSPDYIADNVEELDSILNDFFQ